MSGAERGAIGAATQVTPKELTRHAKSYWNDDGATVEGSHTKLGIVGLLILNV
jgi:hypothetical protein